MAWIVQSYAGLTHVVPDTDEQPHILAATCWCEPVHDAYEWSVVVHRDALDRERSD